ncbi:MAG: hypothetical protein OXP08_03235, partial [bacterium]|nr:hypothetical protein [bacterium]
MAKASQALNRGVAIGAAALAGLAAKMISTGDQLDKMSKRTGVSVENLQRLRFAAEQSGTGIDVLEKGLKRQAKFLADADRGLSTYTRQLAELGLTVADFEGLSPDEAFMKFADAIAAVDDPLRQAALAQEVFGRAGTQLLPLMKEGTAGIKALGDQAEATGNIMSTEAAAKSAELVDTLNELKHSALGVGQELLVSLLPSLISVAEFVRDHVIPAVSWMLENWEKVGIAAGVVALAIGAIPAALVLLGSALAVAWNKSQTFRDIVSAAFRYVTDFIALAVQTQLETLATLLDGIASIAEKFTWLPGPVGDAMGSVADALRGAGDTLRGWGDTVADTLDSAAGWVERHADRSTEAVEAMGTEAHRDLGIVIDAYDATAAGAERLAAGLQVTMTNACGTVT